VNQPDPNAPAPSGGWPAAPGWTGGPPSGPLPAPPPPGAGGPWPAQPGQGGPPPRGPKAGSARTGPLPLHPMTVGDILDGAFKLLKANLKAAVLITAGFVIPLNLLAAFLQRSQLQVGIMDVLRDPSLGQSVNTMPDATSMLGQLGGSLLSLVITPFVAGAISQLVAASYLGRETSAGPALKAAGRRFWSLLLAFLISHAPTVGGTVLGLAAIAAGAVAGSEPVLLAAMFGGLGLIALGGLAQFFLMGTIMAVSPVVVVEGLGGLAAVRRSWRLLTPSYWRVMGIGALSGLIAGVIGSTLSTPFSIPAILFGADGWTWVLLAVGSILPSLVTLPFVTIVATLVYYDARIRREGFDLELTTARLAAGTGPAGTPGTPGG
jgi:hypothetical protein